MLSFIIVSCGSENEQGEQLEFQTTDTEPSEDTISVENDSLFNNPYNAFTDDAAKGFSKYFSPELMSELDAYLLDYNTIKTDDEFQVNYTLGIEMFTKMYQAFYEPKTKYLLDLKEESEWWSPVDVVLEELYELEGEMGPIVFSCVAECTEMDFIYDLSLLEEKAASTNGNADDDFIALSIFNDGEYGCSSCWSWKSWFEPTWDLGGSSLLGEGILLESIEMHMDFNTKYKGYEIHMERMYDTYMNELSWAQSYMHSREEVLKELNDIIEIGLFSGVDLEKILETKAKIEDEKSGVEFDCETGNCSYG